MHFTVLCHPGCGPSCRVIGKCDACVSSAFFILYALTHDAVHDIIIPCDLTPVWELQPYHVAVLIILITGMQECLLTVGSCPLPHVFRVHGFHAVCEPSRCIIFITDEPVCGLIHTVLLGQPVVQAVIGIGGCSAKAVLHLYKTVLPVIGHADVKEMHRHAAFPHLVRAPALQDAVACRIIFIECHVAEHCRLPVPRIRLRSYRHPFLHRSSCRVIHISRPGARLSFHALSKAPFLIINKAPECPALLIMDGGKAVLFVVCITDPCPVSSPLGIFFGTYGL